MKILLACPTHRIEPETLDAIFRLDPSGHDLHMMFTRCNLPSGYGHHLSILKNYQDIRAVFLAQNYDAMLIVESDMIVPPDTLARLAALEADVALGLYVHRHVGTYNLQWPTEAASLGDFAKFGEEQTFWSQTLDVSGGGFGCALIKRRVLERYMFRIEYIGRKNPWVLADCDYYLFYDLHQAGEYTIRMDTSIVCGHKTPEGVVLWPTPSGVRREQLQPSIYPVI